MANTKSNGTSMTEEKDASGMMPNSISNGMSLVGGVLKKTGAATAVIGSVAKLGIPAIILMAVLLPTILAPFSFAINVGIYAFIGYSVLKKTGHLPAALDRGALASRKRQAMGGTPETDMAHH